MPLFPNINLEITADSHAEVAATADNINVDQRGIISSGIVERDARTGARAEACHVDTSSGQETYNRPMSSAPIPQKKKAPVKLDLPGWYVWSEELVPLQPIGEMFLNQTVDEYLSLSTNQHAVMNRSTTILHRQEQRKLLAQPRILWTSLPPANASYAEYTQKVTGIKQRVRGKKFQEHFKQPQLFFNSLTDYEKRRVLNTYTKVLEQIDFDLASSILNNLSGPTPDKSKVVEGNRGKTSPPLSQLYYAPKTPTIKSATSLSSSATASQPSAAPFKAGGALTFLIGTRRGGDPSEFWSRVEGGSSL
ncbi:hypothetical protein BDZ89DRAFT_1240190 [Hymenopellis radicata]|nr:hypothetical protein BDZ89DRAFT_1240190 [Hymenopellis radicata]